MKKRRFVYEIEKGTGSYIDSSNGNRNTGWLWQLFWHSRDHGKRNNLGSGNGKYCIGRNRKHRCKISGRL